LVLNSHSVLSVAGKTAAAIINVSDINGLQKETALNGVETVHYLFLGM
jgi:hypothetical protein